MPVDINALNEELTSLAVGNKEYARFNQRIVNTNKKVLGVRTPDLRRLAKQYARGVGYFDIEQYLHSVDRRAYEHVMLGGMLINYAKLGDAEMIRLAKQYLKLVDSWAEIDMFAQKRKKFDEKLWWDFASKSVEPPDEFVVRYGVIEMMSNFLNEKYINEVFCEAKKNRTRRILCPHGDGLALRQRGN